MQRQSQGGWNMNSHLPKRSPETAARNQNSDGVASPRGKLRAAVLQRTLGGIQSPQTWPTWLSSLKHSRRCR